MKIYQINIKSKNKKSIEKLLIIFKKLTKNLNIKYFELKKKKKVLTILKSPHVNKKAQEQFQLNTFSKSFNIIVSKSQQILTILKLINTSLFTDTKCKIKFINNNKFLNKIFLQVFNLDNFKLNIFLDNKIKANYLKINKFLDRLDIYGELFLK